MMSTNKTRPKFSILYINASRDLCFAEGSMSLMSYENIHVWVNSVAQELLSSSGAFLQHRNMKNVIAHMAYIQPERMY